MIKTDTKIMGGVPCVAGTRIPVETIKEHIRSGITVGILVKDYYPQLTVEQVETCLRYSLH